MKFTVFASFITLAIATYVQALDNAVPTPTARDIRYAIEARDTTNIGFGSALTGATIVIGGETINNSATLSSSGGGSSSSATSTSSTVSNSAGSAAASIRSNVLSSLSANTASNSVNAASIRSGIDSSLSAATASVSSATTQNDGAAPLAVTQYALLASLGAAIAGAFLV